MNPPIGKVSGRRKTRALAVLVLGFLLGGLLTVLCEQFLADSAARDFLTTSVQMSLGPISVDLLVVAFSVSLSIFANALTVVGVFLVALVVRSWL